MHRNHDHRSARGVFSSVPAVVQHGGGGEEKTQKVGKHRAHNTPPASGEPLPGPGHGRGSATGPTAKAKQVNAERHTQEARTGHLAAGLSGRRRAIDRNGKGSR